MLANLSEFIPTWRKIEPSLSLTSSFYSILRRSLSVNLLNLYPNLALKRTAEPEMVAAHYWKALFSS